MHIRKDVKTSRYSFIKDGFISIDTLDITDSFPADVLRVVTFKNDVPAQLFKEVRQLCLKARDGEKVSLSKFSGCVRKDKWTGKDMGKIECYMPAKKAD